ncbi:histone H2A-like [Dermacentor variabilis]|uniref:histone H2A-like n=1 Tax=Dermacentor variabilis TaxID=34621 RepID=UPI003F5C90D0
MTGRALADKATKTGKGSRSRRAGLLFSVGRIHRLMRHGHYADHIGAGAPVYMAAVLQYLTAEMLEPAGIAAHRKNKTRITPRHLQVAVRDNEELSKLLRNVTIAEGDVSPNIQQELLKTQKKGHGGFDACGGSQP